MAIIAYFLVFNRLQSPFLFLRSIFINTFQPYSIYIPPLHSHIEVIISRLPDAIIG